tara:strand:- start:71 stop:1093 length:1023 start_codon:yes stop_codon:yes gene_type:complete
MRLFFLSLLIFNSFLFSQNSTLEKYSSSINQKDLKKLLKVYSSDFFEGRFTGTIGEKRALNFLRDFYISKNIKPAKGTTNYFQNFTLSPSSNRIGNTRLKLDSYGNIKSNNLIAIIEGNENPEEYVVISAHLDHMGKIGDDIYNGADDNGSGTVAILEIAEAFIEAKINGDGPKRSVVFLHVSAEENGIRGSEFYTNNPLYKLTNTIVNLNIDMIGRIDPKRTNENMDYIYLIGSDRLSQELHNISESVNNKTTKLFLDYKYNDPLDPNRFYERSDHFHFAKNNIPVIFYFNGTHDDYHKPSDTMDKINFPLLEKRTRLIFNTAWELANRNKRIFSDKIK